MQCSVGCMNMHHHLHIIYNELVDAVGEKHIVGLIKDSQLACIYKGKQPEYR